MKIVGLTGGIGTGKSTASRLLQKMGAAIVDTDATYHRLLKEDHPMIDALKEAFGEEVFIGNTLNRPLLGQKVFADRNLLQKLNDITHPAIRRSVLAQIEAIKGEGKAPFIVLDSPLLIGTFLESFVEEIWLMDTSMEVRIERLLHRDGLEEDFIRQKIKNQRSIEEDRPHATYIIVNDGTEEALEEALTKVVQKSIIESR